MSSIIPAVVGCDTNNSENPLLCETKASNVDSLIADSSELKHFSLAS